MRTRFRNTYLLFKRIGFYIPFTWYFSLFCIAGWLGYRWLQSQAGIPDSAYKDIFSLLLRFAIWFCFVILFFGLLSVLLSYLFFKWKQKKSGIDFRITTPTGKDEKYPEQTIRVHIHPILKPFLGFIKIRFRYDSTHFSEKFLLIKQSQIKIFSTTFDGIYHWVLPEIKEYRVEKAVVYFEDFFQFFSFALTVKINTRFHTQPIALSSSPITAFPRKTEDTSTRIEELKKVEGEHINYKNFESNDDVRRIVWKIYAKNKELVVRIPEVLDPYASHIYLYASYFSSFQFQGNNVIEIPFLNYYKTITWSVYKQLSEKGFEVRYVPDQGIPQDKKENDEAQVKYAISVSKWQTDRELKEYIKPKDAAVVIISSLSDINDVKEILEKFGNDIAFVFVPLTDSLNKQHLGDWLQWLFVQQEKDSVAVYKKNWSLSLIRFKIVQNEKQLQQLLERYQKSTVLQKMI